MARNTRTRVAESASIGDVPAMPGGSPGIMPTGADKLTPRGEVHTGPGIVRKASVDDVAAPVTRRFVVEGGPSMVMYAQSKTRLQLGKIVTDASCDIAALKRQGVILRELEAPVRAAPIPVEVDAGEAIAEPA